ncbi:MAG: hypothetical protein HRU20_08915 [Pseudomonadales bacterium]|nr:hypothetical protein [Pseudomonadales bacterium]
MKQFLLIVLLLPTCVWAISYAWWVKYTYEPISTTFDAKSAEFYDPNITHLEFYTCDNDRFFTKEQCKQIAINRGIFSLVTDGNGDGVEEEFLIGIAKNKKGKYPYSNIVLIRNAETKEFIQLISAESRGEAFSVFIGTDNGLAIFYCMECGYYSEIKWINNKWALTWPEPYG